MKIRTGFVSNSSSSSFIVAFAKKPSSKDDVMKEMFPYDPKGSIENPWPGLKEHDKGLTHSQIVEQVFSDLQSQKKKISRKELLNELSGRYFVLDKKLYYAGAPYYALDKNLARRYVELHELYEFEWKEFDDFERTLLRTHFGPAVPYASTTGTNWKTKKPCTAEEIKAYEDYTRKVKQFCETDKEYLDAKKKHGEASRKNWNEQGKIADELAKIDLKAFEDANKGAFITRFTYSDNEGSFFSMMEHGDIFHNLNHIQTSHH
jgi:hypothetical protein